MSGAGAIPPRFRIRDEDGLIVPGVRELELTGSGVSVARSGARAVATISAGGSPSPSPGLYYPSSYGTVGAGDDTTALQGAMSAAANARGALVIPGKSSAYLTSPISASYKYNWSIIGEGRPKLQVLSASQASIITLAETASGGSELERNMRIQGLEFRGGNANTPNLLRATMMAYTVIDDCVFWGQAARALYGVQFLVNRISNCIFTGAPATRTGTVGVDLAAAFDGAPANNQNVFTGCVFRYWECGARIVNGAGNSFYGCDFEQNAVALELGENGPGGSELAGNTPQVVNGCWFEGNDLAIRCKSNSPMTVIRDSGFLPKLSGDTSIYIEAGSGPVVIDCCYPISDSYSLRINNQAAQANVHVTNTKYVLASGSNPVTEGSGAF